MHGIRLFVAFAPRFLLRLEWFLVRRIYSRKFVHDLYDMCEQYSNVFHVHFVRRVSNRHFPRFYRHRYCITTIADSM